MPTPQQRKGFEKERDLVHRFWRAGVAAVRAPASGARAKHIFYPDVVAIYKGRVIVLEVKYRGEPGPVYVEKEKLEKLRDFAERAGAEVYIAVKYGRSEWRFIKPEDCRETGNGVRVDPDLLREKGLTLQGIIGRLKGQETLTRFTGKD